MMRSSAHSCPHACVFNLYLSLSRASSTHGRDATFPAEPELIRFLQHKLSLLPTGQDAASTPSPPPPAFGSCVPMFKVFVFLSEAAFSHNGSVCRYLWVISKYFHTREDYMGHLHAMQEDPFNRAISWIQMIRIERFHSRGQHLCKFIGTKESVYIWKEFNSHRIGLEHQHGRFMFWNTKMAAMTSCENALYISWFSYNQSVRLDPPNRPPNRGCLDHY